MFDYIPAQPMVKRFAVFLKPKFAVEWYDCSCFYYYKLISPQYVSEEDINQKQNMTSCQKMQPTVDYKSSSFFKSIKLKKWNH